MQNCGMPPPPFLTWAEDLSTETMGEDLFFWPKTGLNLGEDLFFFGLHLILGKKPD